MIRFLAGRVLWSLVTVWFIVSATFAMVTAIPADPARTLVGPHASPEVIQRVRAAYCLDRSWRSGLYKRRCNRRPDRFDTEVCTHGSLLASRVKPLSRSRGKHASRA